MRYDGTYIGYRTGKVYWEEYQMGESGEGKELVRKGLGKPYPFFFSLLISSFKKKGVGIIPSLAIFLGSLSKVSCATIFDRKQCDAAHNYWWPLYLF